MNLKPCPFCGSKNVEIRAGLMFSGAVHCNACTADVVFNAVSNLLEYSKDWKEITVERWNMRAN